MLIDQISVFLENKQGRLAEVTRVLGENNIDISALSIADTTDFGVLRLITNQPGKAREILQQHGFAASINSVIAIEVEDKPGGLAKALSILAEKGISIEYMYAFVGTCRKENAVVILRVEDPRKALDILKNEDFVIKTPADVYRI
ncbi:MAG TPA: ACT domain-containing protein [Clostridia bacterium]